METSVNTVMERLLKRMDDDIVSYRSGAHPDGAAPMLLNELLSWFMGDSVGEIAVRYPCFWGLVANNSSQYFQYGDGFGFLRMGDPDHIIPAIRNLVRFGTIAGVLPSPSSITKQLLWTLNSELSPAVIGRETAKRVNARYDSIARGEFYDDNGMPQRDDLLNGFMKCKNHRTKKEFTKTEVMSTATSVFAAGVDTTTFGCLTFLYYVINFPSVYARVMEELDGAFKSGLISFPISYADGTKLHYLQACLKEAMRLMNPAGMDPPRHVPAGGILVAGRYFLPKGTEIGCPVLCFHRSPLAFGEDAASFRPERWLNLKPEEKAALERNNLTVGPY